MKRTNWPQTLHIGIASAIFLAVLVLAYQITDRHNRRLDLTGEKLHSLSLPTIESLKLLGPNEILVLGFFAEGDPAKRDFEVFFKEAATHHPRFRYEFYDPDRSPSEAKRLHVDSYQTVIVQSAGREERFFGTAEEDFTNALIRLGHPKKETLCFTEGHGEAPFSEVERTGFSDWKRSLEDHGFTVRTFQPAQEGVPGDCNVVIVGGPHYELLRQELDLLQKIPPEKGTGVLVLVDPMDPGVGTSYDELVKPLGLELGRNVVIDKVSRIVGGDFLIPLVSRYAAHPLTEKFRAATLFPIARTVRKTESLPEGAEVTELAFTHPGSWAETDLKKLEEGEAELDPARDPAGPLPLAAAVEFQIKPRGTRWVVVGDSDFLTNAYLGVAGNRDFSLNIIQWLLQDDRWISIRAKMPRFEPLFLKMPQTVGLAAFSIGGIPLAALFAGSLGIWFRGRNSE